MGHFSLMQKDFERPRPERRNMVCPHSGQLSFVGTSQVMKPIISRPSELVPRQGQSRPRSQA